MLKIKSTLYKKFILLSLIVSLIPLLIVTSYLIYGEIDYNRSYLQQHLTDTSKKAADDILKWRQLIQNDIIQLSHDDAIITETSKIPSSQDNMQTYVSNFLLLEKLSASLDTHSWLEELMITDTSGTLLAYSNYKVPELDFRNENHFNMAKLGETTFSDIRLSQTVLRDEYGRYGLNVPTMFVSTPISGDAGIVGVLTARVNVFSMPNGINLENQNILVSNNYAINSDGYFITKPQKINYEFHRVELMQNLYDPNTNDFTKIFQMNLDKGPVWDVDGYTDYVGQSVIGSRSPIGSTGWSYVVEVDKNTAYSKIHTEEIFLITVVLLTSLLIIGASHFFSHNLIRPIIQLKDATQEVAQGNLSVTVSTKSDDEIKQLSDSFNKMTHSLKKSVLLLEKTEKKYKDLYEKSPSLNRTINRDGIIIDCNQSYADRLGYTKDQIINSSIFKFVPKGRITEMRKSFEEWKKTGKSSNNEIWFQKKTGETFPALISASNLYDPEGNLIGSNTIIRDISDFYKMKQAQEKNQKLEIKMSHIQDIEKQKSEFASMISHELKSPLLPILGYCEFLQDPLIGKLNKDQKQAIQEIEQNSKRLEKLIQDVLNIQKLDMKKLTYNKESFEISDLFYSIGTQYLPEVTKQGVEFVINPFENCIVVSDKDRLNQVFDNLIRNALDFFKDKGRIEVGSYREKGNQVFYVKDNGEGIHSSKLGNLFKKFYQVDTSHSRKHGGTGLGLVVCKGIVEGLGGQIWVESTMGEGTTFSFSIPLPKYKPLVVSEVTS